MTRSFLRLKILVLVAAVTFLALTAEAGVDPSPFKVVLANRSDALPAASPYAGQTIQTPSLELQARSANGDIVELVVPLLDELLPGEARTVTADPNNVAGGVTLVSILTWRITARMGIEPSPFRVYALDSRVATVADPGDAPWLPIALLTEQMSLYAFSSPGTLVGSVTLATDLFHDACPFTDPWKNHGQYVRCIAFHAEELLSQGLISQEAADAAVSAAVRSTVGK